MDTRKALIDFFTNDVNSSYEFFFYKDKQLLKEGKYAEYAREQMKKGNWVLGSFSIAVCYAMFYGVTMLIDYGRDPDIYSLIFGVGVILFSFIAVFISTREYYTIKSSMTLFLKLVEDDESQETSVSEAPSAAI